MRFSVFLPARNICNKHSCSNNIFKRGAKRIKRFFYIFNSLYGLGICISDTCDSALLIYCRCSGNIDSVSGSDRACISYNAFPLCSGRINLSVSAHLFLCCITLCPIFTEKCGDVNQQLSVRIDPDGGHGKIARYSALREFCPFQALRLPVHPFHGNLRQ
jgi:hypothetical protein